MQSCYEIVDCTDICTLAGVQFNNQIGPVPARIGTAHINSEPARMGIIRLGPAFGLCYGFHPRSGDTQAAAAFEMRGYLGSGELDYDVRRLLLLI